VADADGPWLDVMLAVMLAVTLTVREGDGVKDPERVADWVNDGLEFCDAVGVTEAVVACDRELVGLAVDACDAVRVRLGDELGVAVVDAVNVELDVGRPEPDCVCEQLIAAVAPAAQQAHAPEHAIVDRPVVAPKVPTGQAMGVAELAGQ
jgi:hypothetical protein